jgi:hypothetical protein
MFILETEKLKLIPLDAQNLRWSIEDRQKMERNLGVKITDTELEEPVKKAMRTSLKMVLENKKDYLWFTSWEIVLKKENRIIGGLCFKGSPDEKPRLLLKQKKTIFHPIEFWKKLGCKNTKKMKRCFGGE